MKFVFNVLLALAVATAVQGISIRTRVWVKRTGKDQAPPNNELITTLREFGNLQSESFSVTNNVPTNTVFPGAGFLLLDRTFNGFNLPRSIEVRVIEDDGTDTRDDGVCKVRLSTKFTKTPITVLCTREANDGLGDLNIIQVRVQVV